MKRLWLLCLVFLLHACSEEEQAEPEAIPRTSMITETDPHAVRGPGAGDKLIFRMGAGIPEDCAGITFTWRIPGTESGAELSYAFLLPDGKEFRTPFVDARFGAGLYASVYFDLCRTGRVLSEFQGQRLFLQIRVSRGRLLLQHTAEYSFAFHKAEGAEDGVAWFRGFTSCPAELVKGERESRHEAFGHSVHSAGDVDGDGVPDLMAGSFLAKTKGPLTGAASVFSGRDGSLLYRIEGEQAYARFGCALARVGDLDSDSFDEMVVGAPGGGAEMPYQPVSGEVHVYSGRTGEPLYVLEGLNRGEDGKAWADGFGAALSGLDDVDADGIPDLLVGAPGRNRPSFWEIKSSDRWARGGGYAAVFSGANGELLYKVSSARHAAAFGRATASLGDLDLDGCGDFVVGADGNAEVFSGRDGKILFTLVKLPRERIEGKNPGSDAADFGWSVACAGDVNADGTNDILVGALECYVCVFSGRDGSLLYPVFEWVNTVMLGFGETVAGLGDLDRDGHDDFIVGRTEAWEEKDWYDAVIFSGKDAAHMRHIGSDEFMKVGGMGDLDGDGYPDILLGMPQIDQVLVVSGRKEEAAEHPDACLYVGAGEHKVLRLIKPMK